MLAASGHCMVARWAFAPVCGFDYWRVIVTSPEVLIFLFFMITDPKTVPAGRTGRVVFGFLVAVASTLLMAPQTNEFGDEGRPPRRPRGRVRVSPDRRLARVRDDGRPKTACSSPRPNGGRAPRHRGSCFERASSSGSLAWWQPRSSLAGAPARGVVVPAAADVLGRVPHDVDPATFPSISVEQDVLDWNHEITGAGAREIVLTLAENLQLENQALLRADPTILEAVDHGDRLDEMRGSAASRARRVERSSSSTTRSTT